MKIEKHVWMWADSFEFINTNKHAPGTLFELKTPEDAETIQTLGGGGFVKVTITLDMDDTGYQQALEQAQIHTIIQKADAYDQMTIGDTDG